MAKSRIIPFVEAPNQRGTETTDARFTNITYERVINEGAKTQEIYCLKRWGFNLQVSTSTSGAGRGVHSWPKTGNIYSVVGNSVFLNTSTLFSSMNTSTGKVSFLEIPQSTGNEILIIADGQDNYNITSTGVITQIDQADHTSYPVSTIGGICYLDGYVFQGQANGRIWNSQLNSVSSWSATGFLTADTHAGELEQIHLQKDQIFAFTKNRIEAFFNNGNPAPGSPLLRIDQNTIQLGIASKETFANTGEVACFVADNPGDGGGRAIYALASHRLAPVSGDVINRLLNAEGPSITSATAWMETVNGEVIYGLNLQRANRTFIHQIGSNLPPVEWQSSSGGPFRASAATSLNGKVYLQDKDNGNVYVMSHSTYQDQGQNFNVRLQTTRYSFGSPERKYQTGLTIFGDQTSSVVSTYVSDDDYQTTTYVGNIRMDSPRKYISRLGAFETRSYTFQYSENSSFRVQGFLPEFK